FIDSLLACDFRSHVSSTLLRSSLIAKEKRDDVSLLRVSDPGQASHPSFAVADDIGNRVSGKAFFRVEKRRKTACRATASVSAMTRCTKCSVKRRARCRRIGSLRLVQ